MIRIVCIVALVFLLVSCQAKERPEIPEHIQNLDHVRILTQNSGPENTIHLEREIEFGSSDELIIGGLGSFSVDDFNRVFIGDTQQQTIYMFNDDGRHTASLGRKGRGPGEFQYAGYLTILEDLVFAFDPLQFRYNVFSLTNLNMYKTIPLRSVNKRDFNELSAYELGFMHPVSENKFLGSFSTPMTVTDPSRPDYNLDRLYRFFYLLDDTGKIISNQVFKSQRFHLTASVKGEFRSTYFYFLGRTLLAISHHQIYQAWSEEFLIRVYDDNGQYLYAYYYPFKRKKFTREDAIRQQKREYGDDEVVFEYRQSVINQASENDIPEYWPALNDLLVDDENRIWVSTVIDNDDEYEWWVLDNGGAVLARFHWPFDEPIEAVKNGYVYTRKTDEETGLQQVARYRIEMD